MTKKEELSKWRNLTKRNLQKRLDSVNNLLSSLPVDVQSLTDGEKDALLKIRNAYNTLLATWNFNSSSLVSKVNFNY